VRLGYKHGPSSRTLLGSRPAPALGTASRSSPGFDDGDDIPALREKRFRPGRFGVRRRLSASQNQIRSPRRHYRQAIDLPNPKVSGTKRLCKSLAARTWHGSRSGDTLGRLTRGASFDVALFWNSPRRGRTNQPRATPWEWEFPRKTSPGRAQQGAGDVAPFQGSGGCVAMIPGRCPGLICDCPFGANPRGLRFKSAGFSMTLRNSGTLRCGRPIVIFRGEKDFGPASRQWRNIKGRKQG
jgi:hypothetical protein